MTPINYLSLREAIDIVASAKFAGIPDRPAVIEARQAGFDVADGLARDEAVAELWRAVCVPAEPAPETWRYRRDCSAARLSLCGFNPPRGWSPAAS
jgi:hypothetical protein